MTTKISSGAPARRPVPRIATALSVLTAAALVAGCGGGSDYGNEMPPTPAAAVPDSALASSAAYTAFTLMTSQASSETAEPLMAGNLLVPPSSETDEPVPVS